MFSSNI